MIGTALLWLSLAPQTHVDSAALAYRAGDHGQAKRHLHAALDSEPSNPYANDFLATLYMLDGNVEAALKYWNRAGKPHIEAVRALPDPPPVDPSLLDRALAFSPAAVLNLPEYRLSKARLDHLASFRSRIELVPRPERDFDAEVHLLEPGRTGRRLEMLRSLPFLAVNIDFRNMRRKAWNWTNFVRGDPNKQRLLTAFEAPVRGNPSRRLRIWIDGRRETWNFGESDVAFRKALMGVSFAATTSGGWRWHTQVEGAAQRFRDQPALLGGSTLKYRAGIERDVLQIPERRLTLEAGAAVEAGKLFGQSGGRFSRLEASLSGRWFPQASGMDYETRVELRAGAALGTLPLEEHYQLGVERDSTLWLRGHPGTRDGRKGSAVLDRRHLLVNLEFFKRVRDFGLIAVDAGPFADIARVRDVLGRYPGKTLFADPGAQVRLRVLGIAAARISYSRGAFYAALEK